MQTHRHIQPQNTICWGQNKILLINHLTMLIVMTEWQIIMITVTNNYYYCISKMLKTGHGDLKKGNFTILIHLKEPEKTLVHSYSRIWLNFPAVGSPLCPAYGKSLSASSSRGTAQTLTASENSELFIYRVFSTGYRGDLHMKGSSICLLLHTAAKGNTQAQSCRREMKPRKT